MCVCMAGAGSAEPSRSQPVSLGTAPAPLLGVLLTVLFLHPPGRRSGCRGGPDPPVCQPLPWGEAVAGRTSSLSPPRRVTGLAVVSALPAFSLQAVSPVCDTPGAWDHHGLPCRHPVPLAGTGHPEPVGAAVSSLARSRGRLSLSVPLSPEKAGGLLLARPRAGVRGDGGARSRGWRPARGKQLLLFSRRSARDYIPLSSLGLPLLIVRQTCNHLVQGA